VDVEDANLLSQSKIEWITTICTLSITWNLRYHWIILRNHGVIITSEYFAWGCDVCEDESHKEDCQGVNRLQEECIHLLYSNAYADSQRVISWTSHLESGPGSQIYRIYVEYWWHIVADFLAKVWNPWSGWRIYLFLMSLALYLQCAAVSTCHGHTGCRLVRKQSFLTSNWTMHDVLYCL